MSKLKQAQELLGNEYVIVPLSNYNNDSDFINDQTGKVKKYEKALEEITRQFDCTSVNRAKDIANEALGKLTDSRRREIQSY